MAKSKILSIEVIYDDVEETVENKINGATSTKVRFVAECLATTLRAMTQILDANPDAVMGDESEIIEQQ